MAGPRLIIGLGHRKRVGKDTFAGFLEESLASMGWHVINQPFAMRMKEAAHELFRWAGLRIGFHYEIHQKEKECPLPRLGKSPRDIWIEFGNAMRAINPDVWVENLKHEVEWYCSQYRDGRRIAVIIPDVRFPNEAEAVKSWGGTLMKISRSAAPVADDLAEHALDDYAGWNWTLANEGSLDDLRETADRVAKYLTYQQKETCS